MNYIIDEDTFRQFDKQGNYDNFLEDNPAIKDENVFLYELRNGKENNIKEEVEKLTIEKQKLLEEKHKKDEDNRYIFPLTWMEMYLPRFEMVYGKFSYSSSDISRQQKCIELKNYFENVCGVNNIEDVFKRRPHRGKRR